MREGAGEERGRSLRRQQPSWRQGARPGRPGRELVAWVGVVRARGGWTLTQPGLAGQEVAARAEEAAEGGEDGRGSLVAQVAGAERGRSAERAGISRRRQTETREEAAGGRSDREVNRHLLTHRMTKTGRRCLHPHHRYRHRHRPTTRRRQNSRRKKRTWGSGKVNHRAARRPSTRGDVPRPTEQILRGTQPEGWPLIQFRSAGGGAEPQTLFDGGEVCKCSQRAQIRGRGASAGRLGRVCQRV